MKWMPVSVITDSLHSQTSTTTHSQTKFFNGYLGGRNPLNAFTSRSKTKNNAVSAQGQTSRSPRSSSSSTKPSNDVTCSPPQRWYHSAAVIGENPARLYVFGGTTNTSYNVLLNDLYYFDIPEDFGTPRWETMNIPVSWHKVECGTTAPSKRWGHTGLAWEHNLVVFGGCDGYMYLNEVMFFNTLTMQWEKKVAEGDYPAPRAGHKAAITKDNIMIIFGGWNGSHLNDVHFLDLENMKWLKLDIRGQAPPPRADHAVTVVGNKIYLFGGEGVGYDVKLGDVFCLDVDRLEWSTIRSLGKHPTARHSHSLSTVGNNILAFGGYDDEYNQCNDVWIFNTDTLRWSQVYCNHHGHLGIVGRQGHSACVFRSKVVFFGGFNGGALNDIFVLDTEICQEPSQFYSDISRMMM